MKKILFLCTGNSCRSQMAEGWAKTLLAGQVDAYSAGIKPAGVDPLAVKAMAEAGVDISDQRSKHLWEFKDQSFDMVITLCDQARESCPVWLGKAARLHQSFDDPPFLAKDAKSTEEALPHYRRVRDEIRDFVQRLPEIMKANS